MYLTVFDTFLVNSLLYWLSLLLLKSAGWHTQSRLPDFPKYVLAAAPHTSKQKLPWKDKQL